MTAPAGVPADGIPACRSQASTLAKRPGVFVPLRAWSPSSLAGQTAGSLFLFVLVIPRNANCPLIVLLTESLSLTPAEVITVKQAMQTKICPKTLYHFPPPPLQDLAGNPVARPVSLSVRQNTMSPAYVSRFSITLCSFVYAIGGFAIMNMLYLVGQPGPVSPTYACPASNLPQCRMPGI